MRGGLSAEYYNNRWLFGTPAFTRIDEVINFAWDSYITPTGQDYVSIRWTGFVQPPFTEVYNFTVLANDGVKLWIDGEVVIDDFTAEPASGTLASYSGLTSKPLVANRLYDFKMEYRENTGTAGIQLWWKSASQSFSLVPSYRLFYDETDGVEASPYEVIPVG
ncbi:MAG: PA14 domain-containing protein, partial [bacterium]